jgi:hypothetical protein
MNTMYVVIRDGALMGIGDDGLLFFASTSPHAKSQAPHIFVDRKEAERAIRRTNACDREHRYGWAESFGEMRVIRVNVEATQ